MVPESLVRRPVFELWPAVWSKKGGIRLSSLIVTEAKKPEEIWKGESLLFWTPSFRKPRELYPSRFGLLP
jgi:hypothetical protein